MALGNSGRIVLCAVNSEHRWDEQGFPAVDGTPIVLLCFEAVRRHRAPFPGLVRQGSRLDPTLRWYKWLGPAKALGCFRRLKARLLPVPDQWQDGWHIAVSLEGELRAPDTSDMRIMLILDAEGREVHRWVYDGYKRAERSGLVPPDATFRLLDYEELPHPRKAEK
jgi:hypothetical protein